MATSRPASALIAVAVIVAGIVVLNLLQRGPDIGDVKALAARASASASASAKAAAKPSKPANGKATGKAKAKTKTNTKAKPTAKATATATKPVVKPPAQSTAPATPKTTKKPVVVPAVVPAARQPLTVLNSSRIKLLAAGAADDFKRGGWSIAFVGNTTYRARMTTAYYAPGQEAVARRLMAEFPAVQRMLLRPAGLPGKGLTVVVTRDYAD